jgi:ankyrin repeat protein
MKIDGMMNGLKLRAELSRPGFQTRLQSIVGAAVSGQSSKAGTTEDEEQEIVRIQQMIQNSPDLINAPSDGSTPLARAAYHGWLKVAAYLLDHGADVNVASPDIRWTKELTEAGRLTPLGIAVVAGNKAMAQFLIERGADINFKSQVGYLQGRSGYTPLHLAAQQGFQAVVEMLLTNHAAVNVQDSGGTTPLFSAVQSGQLKMIQTLLAAGAEVNLQDGTGSTVLNFALGMDPEIFQALMAAGANPNTVDHDGRTPLSYAADKDNPEFVKMLLPAQADPNAGTLDAPLLGAIKQNDLASAEMLLQAGANPNAKGRVNWDFWINGIYYNGGDHPEVTPLAFAIAMNQVPPGQSFQRRLGSPGMRDAGRPAVPLNPLPMVQLLLKYKADPNDTQFAGQSILFSALSDTNILAALLDAGGRADTRRSGGWPLLAEAVNRQNFVEVQLLLNHQADPNDAQFQGRSILFNALGSTNILEALLAAGAKVDPVTPDENEWTPLGLAANQNNASAVAILLKHGANPNVHNRNGSTPLHWAAYQLVDSNIFELLLAAKADPNVRNGNGRTPLDEVKLRLDQSQPGIPGGIPRRNFAMGRPVGPGGMSSESSNLKAAAIADLLRQHGALDNLPDWDRIQFSRPANQYAATVFEKNTNDWNHFTLLEFIYWIYPNGNYTSLDHSWSSFPDLAHLVIVRPSPNGAPAKRIAVNLLNGTNGVDCSRDVPLEFGDVVEVPEREHYLGENITYLPGDQAVAILNYFRDRAGEARLIVDGGQTVPLPLQPFFVKISEVLHHTPAINALTSNSDLTRVKVTRRVPNTEKTQEWTMDCSSQYTPGTAVLWLRNGDVIEVPEKP